jgi:uncharacterized protein (DUF1778 family)
VTRGRRLDHVFSVRFTPAQFDELSAAAAAEGVTISEFIRSKALAANRPIRYSNVTDGTWTTTRSPSGPARS